jgi:hypothetical protein
MEYYSVVKKNEIVLCRKMDGNGDHHVKQSKLDLKTNFTYFLLHEECTSFKKTQKWGRGRTVGDKRGYKRG